MLDAAFEKRHRRHELAEKRQRLREKEKLQHEHYKLKERIEQLRAMDYNAFNSLPASYFEHLAASDGTDHPDVLELGPSNLDNLHEGERRRRLMLDVAASLEERYRTLLPPSEKKSAHSHRMSSISAEPSTPDEETHHIEESASSGHRIAGAGKARATISKSHDKLHADLTRLTISDEASPNSHAEIIQTPTETSASMRIRKHKSKQGDRDVPDQSLSTLNPALIDQAANKHGISQQTNFVFSGLSNSNTSEDTMPYEPLNQPNSGSSSKRTSSRNRSSRTKNGSGLRMKNLFTTEPLPLPSTLYSSKEQGTSRAPKGNKDDEYSSNRSQTQSNHQFPTASTSRVSSERRPTTRKHLPKMPNWVDTNAVFPISSGNSLPYHYTDTQVTEHDVSTQLVPNGHPDLASHHLAGGQAPSSYSDANSPPQQAVDTGLPSPNPNKSSQQELSVNNVSSDLVQSPPRKKIRRSSNTISPESNPSSPSHGESQSTLPVSIHDFTDTSQLTTFSYNQLTTPTRVPQNALASSSSYRGSSCAMLTSRPFDTSADRMQVVPPSPSETGTPTSMYNDSEAIYDRLLNTGSQSPPPLPPETETDLFTQELFDREKTDPDIFINNNNDDDLQMQVSEAEGTDSQNTTTAAATITTIGGGGSGGGGSGSGVVPKPGKVESISGVNDLGDRTIGNESTFVGIFKMERKPNSESVVGTPSGQRKAPKKKVYRGIVARQQRERELRKAQAEKARLEGVENVSGEAVGDGGDGSVGGSGVGTGGNVSTSSTTSKRISDSQTQSKHTNSAKSSKGPSLSASQQQREVPPPDEDITKYLPMVDYDSYVATALNNNDPGPFRKARALIVNVSRHNDGTGKSLRTIKPFGVDLPIFEDMEYAIPVYLRWETEPIDLEKTKGHSISQHIPEGLHNSEIQDVTEGISISDD